MGCFGGCGGNNCLWIIIILLLVCGCGCGCGNTTARSNDCGIVTPNDNCCCN